MGGENLQTQIEHWTTPQSHDKHGGKTPEQIQAMRLKNGSGVRNLNEDVINWPTASARDWKSETGCENRKEFHAPTLSAFVYLASLPDPVIPDGLTSSEKDRTLPQLWQTPKDQTSGGNQRRGGDRSDELLLTGQAAEFMGNQKKRLSPRFVEWLMGFPIGWTEL
jgi:hypothetical protein